MTVYAENGKDIAKTQAPLRIYRFDHSCKCGCITAQYSTTGEKELTVCKWCKELIN